MSVINQLKHLLYKVDYNKINWTRFFRSNMAAIKQATLEQREEFLRQYIDQIDCFSYAAQICQVSLDFVRQNIDRWYDNDLFYSVNPENYQQFLDKVKRSWAGMFVFAAGDMEQELLYRYANEMDWPYILNNRHLSGQLIDRLIEYLIAISQHYNGFNKEFWQTLSFYQPNLTEQFIDKYEQFLDWGLMSSNQNFNEHMLLKYIDKIDWTLMIQNKNLYLTWPVEKKLRDRGIL